MKRYKITFKDIKIDKNTNNMRFYEEILKKDNKEDLGYTLVGEFGDNIDEVIYNEAKGTTTIKMNDEYTTVRVSKGETFNKRVGLLEAYFEATQIGSKTQKNKRINELIENATIHSKKKVKMKKS